jgi:hypothetical protein
MRQNFGGNMDLIERLLLYSVDRDGVHMLQDRLKLTQQKVLQLSMEVGVTHNVAKLVYESFIHITDTALASGNRPHDAMTHIYIKVVYASDALEHCLNEYVDEMPWNIEKTTAALMRELVALQEIIEKSQRYYNAIEGA